MRQEKNLSRTHGPPNNRRALYPLRGHGFDCCRGLSFFFLSHELIVDYFIFDVEFTELDSPTGVEPMTSQWIERPPGARKVMGSIPVGDSDFFLCPTLVSLLIISSFTYIVLHFINA